MEDRWEEVLKLPEGYRLMRLMASGTTWYREMLNDTWGLVVPNMVAEELLRLAQECAERAALQEEIPAALSRLNRRLEDLESRLKRRISDLEVVVASRRSERAECLDDHDRRLLALETEARTVENTIRRWEKMEWDLTRMERAFLRRGDSSCEKPEETPACQERPSWKGGYAEAVADIRALIARREKEAQDAAARSGDAQYDLWHARAAGLSALLVDIGRGLHRGWVGEGTAEEAPSVRDPSERSSASEARKTLEEAPSEWMEHLADAGNRICSRVEALEKTVGVVAAESAIRVEPLRRLAEDVLRVGALSVPPGRVESALREGGVLPQEEVPHGI